MAGVRGWKELRIRPPAVAPHRKDPVAGVAGDARSHAGRSAQAGRARLVVAAADREHLILDLVLRDGVQAARLSGQQGAAPHVQLNECLVGPGLLGLADAKALWHAAENA